jgi:hypothetical protein
MEAAFHVSVAIINQEVGVIDYCYWITPITAFAQLYHFSPEWSYWCSINVAFGVDLYF